MNSNFQMDAFLEEKLNDIDELIRSELGSESLNGAVLDVQSLESMNDPDCSPGMNEVLSYVLETNGFLHK